MAEHRRTADREVTVASSTTPGTDNRNMFEKTEGRLGHEDQVIPDVRASDIEPYTGLRYLSKLFKVMGVVIALLLVAEIATGLSQVGTAAIPTLLGEASRLLVLAGMLWGVGDLALLLIDVGHDVRAGRVLLSRQTYHMVQRDRVETKSAGIAARQDARDAAIASTTDRATTPDQR